ncbi:hypothetical protein QR680_005418 [Steinernema hermaphroditum]|uniref:SXP/RAL-2 family protein Ani s 5-like cation-binding domain-containing protein n=1 Tax=Steinernema hermaphroditum TaxID=289476 RepID=A0AA39LUU5_9BILA|nr:hypothetical protein QR680_005418 [Steinernema hermaphroditum]
MLLVSVYLGILVALSAAKPSWDYVANRAEQPPYAAWYQVPKSSSNYPSDAGYDRPSSNYERIPGYGRPSQGYAAYTRGMKNPPIEYGSELAVANNVLPGGSRKPIAPYYGNAVGGQPVMAAQDIIKSIQTKPNTELFASIKDVVSKLRSSLDQAGVEQDVKKMGTQLENTWHELRRGSHGRIDRLFERAQQMLQDPAAQRP